MIKAAKTTVAFLAGAVLLAGLVAVSFWAFKQIKEAAGERKHTYEIINRADALLSALKDAETGQRGYALTGDEKFLEPYLAVRDRVSVQLKELRQSTLIGAAHKHLDAIAPLLDEKLAEMSRVIDLRRKNDMPAVQALVSGGQGKRLMDSIRAEMDAFIQIEDGSLARHDADFQANMRHMFAVIVAVSFLTLLCALLFAYMIHRETQHRLKKLVHLETQRLLEVQEEMNKKLLWSNVNLRISEEKLSVTLKSIGDAVISTDADGRVTLLNPLAEKLTGWTQAEAAGHPIDDIFKIINQETRQPAVIPVKETLAHGTIQGLANHTILIARDGSECAIADSCAPIRDGEGKMVGVVLVFRDVTDEYATQQALRDSTAVIQKILNTVVDGIITLHTGGAIVETVNAAAERMFGYTAGELSGQNPSLLIPELARGGRNVFLEASKDAHAVGFVREVAGHRKDGSIFPLEITVSEMWLGGLRHFICILRDISGRRQTEEALLKGGALQAAIFNSANFSSIATDAKGVIQIFNVGAERMLGYTASEVMNKITPADISDPQEVIARAKSLSVELGTQITPGFEALVFKASRGIEDIYELTYIRKDGSSFPAVVSVTALRDAQDSIIGYLLIGTDNTARKMAEEALLKGGALQAAIFNSANFSSIATDAKGVIQIFNVGAERMLGYTAAEVMNKITPADISDPQEVIARAKSLSVELGTPITPGFEALVFKASRGIEDIYELTYIRKDGSRFPAVVSVTALRDDHETIIGYLLIGTELKAGALQSAIFNSANFSSIATDAKGVIQIFNVGAERMLGYTAAEVMNKITPADISDPQEVITRAKSLSTELGTPITPGFEALVFKASRGIEDIYELTYIRKDGSRFPAVVSVTALRNAQDIIIGYLLIGTDNTARKQIEAEQKLLDQRLRDQQFYTRSLIESNIDALITTNPSGIITDINKQMETLTGCTRDELIGAPFKNYFTDPDRAEASIKLVLSEKKVNDYELTAHDRDGKETVVSYNATTFYDRDRKLQGVVAVARDVTERKRVDLVLQKYNVELESAKSVAEKANLAKSDFLSSMSHELRSPLNAILGFAQLMDSSASPLPTNSQKENIGQILQAGWHLLKLINEILDLAVIESGKVSLSPESVSLAEVMSECQNMMEAQAQQRGIRLSFPRFDKPFFVKADRTRLKQIIINLLSNAIKYNRDDGAVVVDCTANASNRVRISVSDTGAGLSPEKLAQLFQPFNRLGQEAGGVAGTGIGLVVTKRLAELMDGVLGVESKVGEGSVFWCELKSSSAPHLVVEEGEAKVEAFVLPQLPAGAAQHTLLYVEDNPANMKMVEQLIGRFPDMRLLTAVNGILGIDLARSTLPNVILMDINLPGISGIEALKILKKDPATAHIPVVALSANAMPRDIEKGLDAGFFRYITKPIKVKEFMETLNEALEHAEKNKIEISK
ncbi:MAG: PAS domain S-box protein [Victivallales bacterium]